ncbi:hypothetical protein CYMTET_7801 [Cymbomonas tetramitiformis]|uniref:Uncharacterized protein n=1 Tax=Cymbomonas tetramitiformis TaxID=36881 RepID=A0AAE0GUT3_9CHLO|nr:hypothetical protein CYMTET_7801 [Cymbomonas tetramitiformis]
MLPLVTSEDMMGYGYGIIVAHEAGINKMRYIHTKTEGFDVDVLIGGDIRPCYPERLLFGPSTQRYRWSASCVKMHVELISKQSDDFKMAVKVVKKLFQKAKQGLREKVVNSFFIELLMLHIMPQASDLAVPEGVVRVAQKILRTIVAQTVEGAIN